MPAKWKHYLGINFFCSAFFMCNQSWVIEEQNCSQPREIERDVIMGMN